MAETLLPRGAFTFPHVLQVTLIPTRIFKTPFSVHHGLRVLFCEYIILILQTAAGIVIASTAQIAQTASIIFNTADKCVVFFVVTHNSPPLNLTQLAAANHHRMLIPSFPLLPYAIGLSPYQSG